MSATPPPPAAGSPSSELLTRLDCARQNNAVEEVIGLLHALGDLARAKGEQSLATSYYERVLAWRFDDVRARALLRSTGRLQSAPGPTAESTQLIAPDSLGPLAARYRILKELGRGGAGTVYLALDVSLQRKVAVKLLHQSLAPAGGALLPEADLIGALSHPGVVRILDLDRERGLVVMEYLAGGSLRTRLGLEQTLGVPALRALAESLLETLVVLHGAGVVHADLTPANILFRREGDAFDRPVLADFGVARRLQSATSERAAGTLGYQAPELVQGASASVGGDLYALGVVLREAGDATLRRERRRQVSQGEGIALPPLRADFAASLRPLVEALTQVEVEDRPADAQAALELLHST